MALYSTTSAPKGERSLVVRSGKGVVDQGENSLFLGDPADGRQIGKSIIFGLLGVSR